MRSSSPDAQRGATLRGAQHLRRAPVAGEAAVVRAEQHEVGGHGGGAEILLGGDRVLGAHDGHCDERRRAVQLGRRVGARGLLQAAQRLAARGHGSATGS